jgi:CRP-like cAMP-binding protein
MVHVHHASRASTQSRLLNGLNSQEVTTIISAATNKKFGAGKVIFTAGEPAKRLYLLQKGMVKFYRATSKGKEVLFELLVPGDAFGLGTILAKPIDYIGTAEAQEGCDILVWDHASVRRLASAYPRITENTLNMALQYVELFMARQVSTVSSNAEERLAHTLTRLGIRSGRAHAGGIEIALKNEHLASLADVSAFTASRVLSKWGHQGTIKKTRGKVLILVPEKLVPN